MTVEQAPTATNPVEVESLIDSSEQFEMLKNPYDRMEYVHLTDELIRRLEGTDKEQKPDFVIYMDKSARPVSWMVRELWDDLAREPGTNFEDNIVPERPKSLFLNIDSKHLFKREDIPGLRSLFTTEIAEDLEGIEDKETFFDGKRILVVDEIGVSHATRVKATAYLEMAFPEATVDSFTWMDQGPQTQYGGQGMWPAFNKERFELVTTGNPATAHKLQNNLRWYQDRSNLKGLTLEEKRKYDDGRGIIDKDAATEEELANLDRPRTKLGKEWLSAVPKTKQPLSKQIMKEIKLLGQELRSGVLPYWPSEERTDAVERIAQTNNDIDPKSFREFTEWFKDTWWVNWNAAMQIMEDNKPRHESYVRMKARTEKVASFAIRHGLYAKKTKVN